MTEYNVLPEPMPSISTPIPSSTDLSTETNRRPRRHTIIARPDSGMALLSDIEDDDQEQQETFDRISGILSSLIQEANEAVNGIEQERVQLLKKSNTHNSHPMTTATNTASSSKRSSKTPRIFTSSTILTDHSEVSRIPRPNRKLRASYTPSHYRNGSSSSSTSTISTNTSSALFSPVSTSTSATLSRSPSPTTTHFKKQLLRHHTTLRPRSCPVNQAGRHKRKNSSNLVIVTDPISESFKRLDTSMALVESLSRDLATPQSKGTITRNSSNGFTFLLLVPLLHIPHSLITMIFDFCFTTPSTSGQVQLIRQQSSFSITSMIFWACVFAVTNLMVDQVTVIPKKYLSTITNNMKTRRMSLPGTYTKISTTTKRKKTIVHKQEVMVKRSWIPTTIQQQYQFRLGNEQLPTTPQFMQRRNSI